MSKTRMISVTIPEKVLVKIERDAKEMNRSRSNQVATILSQYYEKGGKKK